MIEWLIGFSIFLLVLSALAAVGDRLDAERDEARRRNRP